MTIECWTVIHRVTEPIKHAAPIRHLVRHIARALPRPHPGHIVHAAVSHPRTWIEVVCRALPAAAAAGGVLIPRMAGPPPSHPLPQSPPPIVAPAPAPSIGFAPPLISFPPPIIVGPPIGPPAEVPPETKKDVPEPSSLALLLGGLGGLAVLPAIRRRRPRHHGDQAGRNSVSDNATPTTPG